MPTPPGARRRLLGYAAPALAALAILSAAACGTGPADTPRITPGTSDHPRTVIVIARDYTFEPPVVDLVPGETVLVQVVNGGLVTHEAVVGPSPVQDAWEAAEAPTASAPPGPTPQVSVEPDIAWTVPPSAAGDAGGWFVGCHIPGHWAQGMVVPVRFVGSDGLPLATLATASGDTLRTARREGRSAASR
jgi:hypothetical protein